jgi:hypothetical protein
MKMEQIQLLNIKDEAENGTAMASNKTQKKQQVKEEKERRKQETQARLEMERQQRDMDVSKQLNG